MDSVPSLDQLRKLRVVDLKERLAKLGKSTSGLKADLLDRLYNALNEQAGHLDMMDPGGEGSGSYPQPGDEMSGMEPLNPVSEPPVVEVTIDTSQFDCGVEPQIVSIGPYVMDNVQEVTVDALHMEQVAQQQGVYYGDQVRVQRMDEEEIQRRWLEQENLRHQQQDGQRQQLEEEEEDEESAALRQQEEAAHFAHQQREMFRLQQEAALQEQEAELQRQREFQLQQEQEAAFRRQQEAELRRQEEEAAFRRQQEAELLLQEEEAEMRRQEEEAELRRQEEEAELRRVAETEELRRVAEEAEHNRLMEMEAAFRRQQDAELRRQQEAELMRQQEAELRRQQEAEVRRQQEAELRRQQEAELRRQQEAELRLQHEAELRRQQEEAELKRQLEEQEEQQRRHQAELQRQQEAELRRQQEEVELRLRQEEAELRRQQEEAELRRQQEEAELRRQQEEAELRRQQEETELRLQQEEAELRRQQEEAELRLQQEEAKLRRQQEELELRRQQEEAELRRQLEEAELQRQKEVELRRLEDERQQQEKAFRLHQEAELRRQEEAELQQQQEAERLRQVEEEAAAVEREEQLRVQRQQETELRLRKEREERQRMFELAAEQEREEKRRIQEEMETQRRINEAEETATKEREKQRRIQEEHERQRRLREEEERIRKQRESDEKLRREREEEQFRQQQKLAAEEFVTDGAPAFLPPGMAHTWMPPPGYQGASRDGGPHQLLRQFKSEDMSPPPSSPPPIPGLGPPSPGGGLPPALMSLDITRPEEEMNDEEVRLPHALEKALAFKTERAQQLGIDPDTIDSVPLDMADEDDDETEDMNMVSETAVVQPKSSEPRPSKNKRRKMKKKKRAGHRRNEEQIREFRMDEETGEDEVAEPDVEVQYIEDNLDLNPSDPMYHHFMKIFQAFKLTDPDVAKKEAEEEANRLKLESQKQPDLRKKPKDADEEPEEDIKKETHPKLSKRKMKKLNRLSIAELKQHVSRPDVVEMHDVTAKDPKLLVLLKSTRNTVPVPRHWCFKRKYLQGKRGIEKPPFDLPEFIKKTGIMEMRQALQEKEDQKTLKAKMRERVRPKLGKIDIDYQKLHDAFFKWQTKPRMTIHGDLYYEGKEFETRLKEKKPGELSDDLRTALGMPVGPNSQKIPSPWLIAMQRYGPPPSYPNLKIPGLNSPIPDSCSFGYHAGGWGKPPVDEMGKPLYGDVFGMQGGDHQQPLAEEEVDRTLWGELESESESESEEEEDEDEDDDDMEAEEPDKGGLATPADGGLVTPSGIASIPMGMETPDMIELRKRKIETEMEGSETPALYTILPEKKTDRVGASMMGSTHIYDIAAAMPGRPRLTGANAQESGVEVALDPSELDLDAATMTARYEQTLREQQNRLEKEDLSDMVAEHSAKQKSKRKRAAGQQDVGRAVKKYKDFKF